MSNQPDKNGKPEHLKDLNLKYDFILVITREIHINEHYMKSLNCTDKITFAAPKTLLIWARAAGTDYVELMATVPSGEIRTR